MQSGGADPRDAEEAAAAQTGIAGTGVTVLQQGPKCCSDKFAGKNWRTIGAIGARMADIL